MNGKSFIRLISGLLLMFLGTILYLMVLVLGSP